MVTIFMLKENNKEEGIPVILNLTNFNPAD